MNLIDNTQQYILINNYFNYEAINYLLRVMTVSMLVLQMEKIMKTGKKSLKFLKHWH